MVFEDCLRRYVPDGKVVGGFSLLIMFLSYVVYSAVIPVFPSQAKDCGMSSFQIGVVVGAFPVGMLITALGIGPFLPRFSSKYVFICSLMCASFSLLFFASIPFFFCDEEEEEKKKSDDTAFYLFVLFRFFQGGCAGIAETCVLYSLSVKFSGRLGEMIAYQETSIGIALLVGPVLGGSLYTFFGFFYCFFVFAILDAILSLCIFFWFPRTLQPDDYLLGEDQESENESDDNRFKALSASNLFTFWVLFWGAYLFNSQEVVVPLYLDDKWGWGALIAGFCYGGTAFCYAITAIIVGHILDRMKHKTTKFFKLSYSIGFSIQAIGFYFLGPLPFDQFVSKPLLIIGLLLIGVGFGFILTPSLPDAQMCVEVKTGKKSQKYQSFMSSIWVMVYSLATAIGSPVIGYLYEEIGFLREMYIYSCISVLVATTSFLFAIFGPE